MPFIVRMNQTKVNMYIKLQVDSINPDPYRDQGTL